MFFFVELFHSILKYDCTYDSHCTANDQTVFLLTVLLEKFRFVLYLFFSALTKRDQYQKHHQKNQNFLPLRSDSLQYRFLSANFLKNKQLILLVLLLFQSKLYLYQFVLFDLVILDLLWQSKLKFFLCRHYYVQENTFRE